ncbi:MAG: ATP-binding protein, partial [Oscillospiraceae bacterium]|nr:ATP-binding protein [Oscillospiraceae bacterium]
AVFSDVDDMKRLEEAAKEQQLRYEVAIKSSGINIWEYDIQTDCLTVVSNSSRIKQNCYTIEHYVAATVEHDYVREDSLPAFYNIFRRLKNGEKEVVEDIWYKTTDEAGWWCERVIYTTVFGADGKPLKAFGAGRDVTREKEAIRKFEEEMHYRTAIQGNSLGSMKIDLTRNIILEGESPFPAVNEWIKAGNADSYFANNAACISDMQKNTDYCKDFNRRGLINRFNGGEYLLSMNFARLLDVHHICWLQYNVHLAKNPENNNVIAFIIAHDITDEQVMKMVMETVTRTDYEFFVVADGSINSATDYGTARKAHLFSPDQPFEARCEALAREVVCDEDVERVVASCKIDNVFAHIENGGVYKLNYSIRDNSGEIRRKQLQFTLIHRERKTFLMTRIDVNEVFAQQEQAQRELKKALHGAQSAAKAKTDFLSRMSHDIRTPLNAVIGLSGLGAASESMEEMRDYYKQIETSGKYLLSIINDVLDMSKIEGRTLVLHPSVVYLPAFIRDTVAIVMPMVVSKSIQFEVKQKGIASQYMRFDATYLRQVVVNLLSNAVKFTPNGGHIELCLENLSRNGNYVRNRMIVRDNGIGISEAFLSRIFLPFEQENTQNDITRKGTGLGLSIVKSIIDLMGGSIRVESEKGKGTAFLVEWDLETASAADMPVPNLAVSEKTAALEGCRILLCEDNSLNTQIATKLLEKKKVVVIHADNGQMAVELFQKSKPHYFDAILMDIRMPVMDGLAATREIRTLNRSDAKTVPIIAMTANAFAEDVQQSLEAGMNVHLAKPIEPQMLYQTLEQSIMVVHEGG